MIAKIFDALGRHIETQIHGSTRHIGYGRELHSYPAFSIIRPTTASYTSNIRHLGDGQKLYIVRCAIRGYTLTSRETAMDDIELFARQLEQAVLSFTGEDIDDARVLSVETDEGLFAPLAICDLEVEIFYVEA